MQKHKLASGFEPTRPAGRACVGMCRTGPPPSLLAPCSWSTTNLLKRIRELVVGAFALAWIGAAVAANVDEDAAQSLAKKSGCLKCHAIDKKKDAPSYKSIAEKYKSKPDAEDKLFKHATSNPEVEVDGKKEKHDSPKSKDEKEIRNLVRWVLTR